MLEDVLRHLRNWFVHNKHFGEFVVENGSLELPFLQPNQYYRIIGSVFNDGLHKNGDTDLTDETFSGAVWALAIPQAVIKLATEIEEWNTANQSAVNSPYQSESFGGYSYTLKSGNAAEGENSGAAWQSVFRQRLDVWRKI